MIIFVGQDGMIFCIRFPIHRKYWNVVSYTRTPLFLFMQDIRKGYENFRGMLWEECAGWRTRKLYEATSEGLVILCTALVLTHQHLMLFMNHTGLWREFCKDQRKQNTKLRALFHTCRNRPLDELGGNAKTYVSCCNSACILLFRALIFDRQD